MRRRAPLLVALAMACVTAGSARAGGPPEPVEPGARLPQGGSAAEHWDLAAHFDSGHRLYVRFLITNQGPGDRTALAFGHLLRPDGPPVEFRNGRRQGRWKLSDDRRRIDIGSSLLVLGESARHFEVDNDKRDVEIHLDFPADGTSRRAPAGAGGYHLDLLNLATPATARFQVDGMKEAEPLSGHVLLTHTWFERPEAELLLRRLDFASFDPEARLFLSERLAPDGKRWRWGVTTSGDAPLAVVAHLELEERGGRGTSHPVPDRLEVRGEGLSGVISLGETRLELNPLDALPGLLRMVYSFGGEPRQLWVDATAEMSLKSPAQKAALRWRTAGFANLVFLDSLPPEQR